VRTNEVGEITNLDSHNLFHFRFLLVTELHELIASNSKQKHTLGWFLEANHARERKAARIQRRKTLFNLSINFS